MTPNITKQVVTIELQNLLIKRANQAQYDARKHHTKMNPREIDEIISKYILYHLQQFFKDGPPVLPTSNGRHKYASTTSRRGSKRMKKNNTDANNNNVFYVDKASAVKTMKNKTIKNR
jgi:hypothetical protein